MEMLRFLITPEGTLGEPYFEEEKVAEKQELLPGAALAALLEDEEDDWGGDAPDVSAEFARLGHLHEEIDDVQLPLTADFAENADGTLTLMRWPRLARPAIIPAAVDGKTVTAIGATAFSNSHIEETHFASFASSPISYSVFCMRMSKHLTVEQLDEGGPTSVSLPSTLTHIGPYAFWHCDNLTEITVPRGVSALPAGVFGECSRLEKVVLHEGLTSIGYLPRATDQVMPDVGVFAGCHSLKELTLPSTVTALGAHTFNSSGLVHLTALDAGAENGWSRDIAVATTAFDHSAALLWLDKADLHGTVLYRIALPVARDKILAGDRKFGSILRVPVDFFREAPPYFDALAQEAFRLDFSFRMALVRLQYAGGLSAADRDWYRNLLVQYFDRAPQYMPRTPGENEELSYAQLFDFLDAQPELSASDMSSLLRTAGLLGLSSDLLAHMMEIRTLRFETVTGFEDLDL